MTDEKTPPAGFANPLESWSDLVERQVKLARAFPAFGLAPGTAAFKARVQKGGRLSIPDAERDALTRLARGMGTDDPRGGCGWSDQSRVRPTKRSLLAAPAARPA